MNKRFFFFYYLSIWFLWTLPNSASTQSMTMTPVCKTYREVLQHDGQVVQVFGRLARAYHLPQQPYILLLPDNQWLFLGAEEVLPQAEEKSQYILVEGQVSKDNPSFKLAEFSNRPAVFPAQELVENPEELIRSSPTFTSITTFEYLPICQSEEAIAQHPDQWIVLHGLLSLKKNRGYFQSSKKAPFLEMELDLEAGEEYAKRNVALVVVKCKVESAEVRSSDVLLHWRYPQVADRSSVQAHLGQVVAMKGRLRHRKARSGESFPVLKIAPKTFIYLAGFAATAPADKYWRKRVRLLGKVLNTTPFFLPQLAVFRPGVAVAYVDQVLWLDRK